MIETTMNHDTSDGRSSPDYAEALPIRRGNITRRRWSSMSDGMRFSANGKTIVSVVKTDQPEELVVPEGTEVIADHAFGWCDRLRSVSFPASLKKIGMSAFFSCRALEKVEIANDELSLVGPVFACTPWFDRQPPGAVYLGSLAFDCHGKMSGELRIREGTKRVIIPKWSSSEGCNLKGIRRVVLPASVTEFQTTTRYPGPTLMACRSLEAYEVSPGNPRYSSLDGLLYDKGGRRLLLCPAACETIRIPEHVTEIADDAFHYSYKVKELHVHQHLLAHYPGRLTLERVNAGPGWDIIGDDE